MAKNYCGAHYNRWKRNQPLDTPLRVTVPDRRCEIDGCGRKHAAKGLCTTHFERQRQGVPLDRPVRSLLKPDVDLATRLRHYAPEGRPDECWEWTMCRNKDYGMISVGESKLRGAHIVAWELANNRKLPNGMVIRHTCDNPPCTNPAHLLLGTHADNVNDKVDRGRLGEPSSGFRHRSPNEVAEMRRLYTEGVNMNEISRRFNCSRATVGRIIKGEAYPNGAVRRVQGRAKLTDEQVRTIRRLYVAGTSQQKLAEQFDMHQTAISMITRRKTYSHVI